MRGDQQDLASALKVLLYQPLLNTNFLSHIFSSVDGEVLEIRVSDKRSPDDVLDEYVFCGDTSNNPPGWQV